MLTVDLNCDVGEGMPNDEELMRLVSSANIACGGHTGDRDSMKKTIELALRQNVAIGAHPSYNDRSNFGRVDLLDKTVSLDTLQAQLTEQIGAFNSLCQEMGALMSHVKPHGALYNRAAIDLLLADMICAAVGSIQPGLLLYGLSGSLLQKSADRHGLVFISEVFADRTYQPDGTLTPRTSAGALITDETLSEKQVINMVMEGWVQAIDGSSLPIEAETICVHGDHVGAVAFAGRIRKALSNNGIKIGAPQRK